MMKIEYLMNPKRRNAAAHLFSGGDTLCRMYSTGGINKRDHRVYPSNVNRYICTMCSAVFRRLIDSEVARVRQKPAEPPSGAIYLACPYHEKDLAKSLGARWDARLKSWYVAGIEDITPFMRWIPRPNTNQPKEPSCEYANAEPKSGNTTSPESVSHGPALAVDDTRLSTGQSQFRFSFSRLMDTQDNQFWASTGPKIFTPMCNCDAEPWEDCEHTDRLANSAMFEMLNGATT